ncbi:class IIb bacteriocin, lactobin A/cerein 7B family [Pseudoalteromonas sp. HL-AS1]|nr:class IIb bacteriocin, lactobin A/cerein 7B family [Pseudoalteromonas sp. HL-AS1]WMS90824.1 class IIb bacteriocin, lactobin A/cerein 7B family [Pseudoalteromonas sp. HL-AS1]
MIELKKHELEQVDGGLVPLVVGAGFAVGMALAYITRK